MRIFFSLIVLSLFSGCISVPKLSEIQTDDWEDVALIVETGGKLRGIEVGTTAFSNEWLQWDVPNYYVDDELARILVSALRTHSSWRMTTDFEFADRLKNQLTSADASRYHEKFELSDTDRMDLVAAGYDALILLRPAYRHQPHVGYFEGVGVFSRSFLGIEQHFNFASIYLKVYDLDNPEQKPIVFPVFHFKKFKGLDSFEELWKDYTQDEQEFLLNGIQKYLEDYLTERFLEFASPDQSE